MSVTTSSTSFAHTRRETLTPVEREMVVTVLEDSVHQLSVLGAIMPPIGKPSATSDSLSEALSEILENQRLLEEKFHHLSVSDSKTHTNIKDEIHGLSAAAQTTNNIKTMEKNLEKLQGDREFLQSVMTNTMHEVQEYGTIQVIQTSIEQYQSDKHDMEQAIKRKQESQKQIHLLKKQLKEVKKERDEKIARLDEEIAHCKDQLQEIKARTGLVNKYVKKQSEVRVQCNQRRHQISLEELEMERDTVNQKSTEEKKAHLEVEEYLNKHIEDLNGKVDYWMARYEEDLDGKTTEVQDLKLAKSNGLQKLDELTQTYKQREEVVVEHRAMKERQRRKEEQDKKENMTATKLQAWWRGVMVRKGLGQYNKGKKKGKKGKKGAKKGGKKGKKKGKNKK